ncbi:thiamine pyrophosphate-dependent enzyme [Staphylococcus kloosii]|jgi:sulfopyruvate decarboxylase subunit beta|uniref:thiamine pyrophosphate-dependent enzyme n=1 Tax=Staphylococcus kloosii TaxID=29384 RepID=UPI00189D8B15|nr:thiamine pyrophosphate-dependent enzyme [Staphylococcus kloosii]MBF7023318.1 sulfopyruvate decarboxylase subunit beta [Staphylococcus kloosii]MBF7026019.1 sulfopyruvate decarboxylase subunit beta [Staphylococcus kloosii]
MERFDFLKKLSEKVKEDLVISPLGYTSREWFGIKDRKENFYFLGSMGMPISFALGVAMSTEKNVIAIEGDGSCLMNLGGLSTIGSLLPPNLKILIIDNESYGSTGGQPSATSKNTNLEKVAESCGIFDTKEILNDSNLENEINELFLPGTKFRVLKLSSSNSDIPRIDLSANEIKQRFERQVN